MPTRPLARVSTQMPTRSMRPWPLNRICIPLQVWLMSTRPHQSCGNAWLVTPHSCPASRQIGDLMMLHQLLRASRRTKSSTMLHLPSRLRLSLALSRPWTGAVAAWSAPDRLPRLAILSPPRLPPMWFSRTTSAPATWVMPNSARCLPVVKAISHRGHAASRPRTQQLLRLPYALHVLCLWSWQPARSPTWPA